MKVQYKFDPFKLVGISKRKIDDKDKVLKDVKDYVLEQVLDHIGDSVSPVTGKQFKALKKSYKTLKNKEGGTPVPNLELTGSMLDSLKVEIEGDKLVLKVSESEAPKADNHNKFSAASKRTPLPARKFIPNSRDDETFSSDIIKGIKGIIEDASEE